MKENKLKAALEPIRADAAWKESTARLLEARREKARPRRAVWTAAAACCCAVLLLAFGALRLVRTPVAYVSIDVNPSVELALNRFDRVVSASAYNRDGETVLEGLSLQGKLYTRAIELLLDSTAMQPYLTDTAALTFTVAAESAEKEQALQTGIEASAGYARHRGESCRASLSSLQEAHENGLSFGKYAAYLTLAQYDEDITPRDCQSMTMSEIHEQIRRCQRGNEAGTGPGGNGSGEGGHHGYQGGRNPSFGETSSAAGEDPAAPPPENGADCGTDAEQRTEEENCSSSGMGNGGGQHHGKGNGHHDE